MPVTSTGWDHATLSWTGNFCSTCRPCVTRLFFLGRVMYSKRRVFYCKMRCQSADLQVSKLRARGSPLLQIGSWPCRPQGLLGRGLLLEDSLLSRQLCNLVCRDLTGWWDIISWWDYIHRTTLKYNIRPTQNISSIILWLWRFAEPERKLHCSTTNLWILFVMRKDDSILLSFAFSHMIEQLLLRSRHIGLRTDRVFSLYFNDNMCGVRVRRPEALEKSCFLPFKYTSFCDGGFQLF